jgi:tetratricopeptide (TPR) repeat protein
LARKVFLFGDFRLFPIGANSDKSLGINSLKRQCLEDTSDDPLRNVFDMKSRSLLICLLGTAAVLVACSGDPQLRKQKYIASGDEYLKAGKVAEAVIEYRNAVQQDPRAGEARAKLADAYVKTGDGGKALEEYVRAADLLPEDSAVHLKASSILLLARRFDDAKALAEKVLAREPQNLEAQILLANALAGLKEFDAAVEELEQAITLNPERGETYSNLGALELGRGQKEAAERAFLKAVEINGKSAAARLALANFYWADARWTAVEKELRTVIDLEPSNLLAHRALASFYIATNRAAEAETHFKAIRDLSKTPAAALALGDYYVARKDDQSARAIFESLTESKEAATVAEVRLARLDRRSGQRDAAYQRVDKVLEKDQANLYALLTKTNFLSVDGRLEEALGVATVAAEKHPNSPEALFALGGVQAARHQNDAAIASYEGVLRLNARATDAKIALARLHLGAGRADTSLGLAQDAAASQPQNPIARLELVRALLASRELQKAEAELNPLSAKFPDSPQILTLVGVLKGTKQDPAGARKAFERALELDQNSNEALAGLVVLDLQAKRTAEALSRVDARVTRTPSDPAMLMLAARTHASTGDLPGAENLLRRAIEADSGYLEAYGVLAQLYVKQGKLDSALNEFEELARRERRPVAALTFAGMILQSQGKVAEARDRFRRVLEIDPEAPVAANNLAWLYAESGENIDLALDLAMRAKAKLPDVPQVNDTIGWVHLKKNLAPLSIPYFEQSIEKDANNPTYHYHLGLAHAQVGDSARARQALSRALALKPDFPGAGEARRVLSTVQP